MESSVFFVLFLGIYSSFAQQKTVRGTITTAEDGQPLPGASVIIEGTSRGTQTDFDGNFSIEASSTETLVISYVGFKNLRKNT